MSLYLFFAVRYRCCYVVWGNVAKESISAMQLHWQLDINTGRLEIQEYVLRQVYNREVCCLSIIESTDSKTLSRFCHVTNSKNS